MSTDEIERLRNGPAPLGDPNLNDDAAVAKALDMGEPDSRAMFVARLENIQKNGDKWLTVEAVLALLNDCDMLAAQPEPVAYTTTPWPFPQPKEKK